MNKYKSERFITQRQSKSTGLWSFQVFIRYEDKTITKTFNEKEYGSTKLAYESAIAFKYKTFEDIRNKTIFKKNKITIREVFEEYLETTTDSYTTKQRHIGLFNKYITKKDKPIQDVTKADIQNDLNSMVEIATDDTIMRIHCIWKNDIVGTALMNDYITKDISLGVKKPKSHLIHIKKDTTTDRDTILRVENLLLNSQKNKYNSQMIVYLIELLYYTGMRPAEAIALTRDDFHNGVYISVTKELGSNLEEDNVIRRCKTPTSVRDIPISPLLRPIVDELLTFSRTEEVFRRDDGRYMDSTWVGNTIRQVLKTYDKTIKFNLYRLRHNMATELISNRVDSRTTMDILGHSSFNMSLYYANSNNEQRERAVELIS